MPSQNNLKQRIHAGEVVVALRVPVTTTRSELEAGLAGGDFAFLYVDGQHTAFSEQELINFCALAEEFDLPVQFRIPHTRHSYLVGRYLDLGPTSVMIPEVTEVATVEEAIQFAYYSPVGLRSWGGAARRQAPNGTTERRAYADWWNEYVVLTIQLESVAAVNNARQLALPGVDVIAFGPNDLEFSLETHPEFPLRTVDECMRNVAAQVADTDVRLSMAIPTRPEEREKFLEMGVTIFQQLPG